MSSCNDHYCSLPVKNTLDSNAKKGIWHIHPTMHFTQHSGMIIFLSAMVLNLEVFSLPKWFFPTRRKWRHWCWLIKPPMVGGPPLLRWTNSCCAPTNRQKIPWLHPFSHQCWTTRFFFQPYKPFSSWFTSKFFIHCVGLRMRENPQETINFPMKHGLFL